MTGPKKPAWTDDELAYLRANFPNQTTASIASALGRSVSAVQVRAAHYKLHKSAELITRIREAVSATKPRKPRRVTAPAGEAVNPGVKVTYCPGYRDNRLAVELPADGYVAQWRALRGSR